MRFTMSLSFKTISADSHVVEPPDLWTKRIDRRFLDRAPRIVGGEDTDYLVVPEEMGGKRGIGLVSAALKKNEEISMNGRFAEVLPGGYDPAARLEDQDRDNVEAEILYTSFGLTMYKIEDLDFQFACMQAFNDWLANFCASAPNRFYGAAMIPTQPLERGIQEMRRCADMGVFRTAQISINHDAGHGYNSTEWDPLWATAEELQMPLSLHVAGSKKSFSVTNDPMTDFCLAFTEVMYQISRMVISGVFDRFRDLKVVSVENDAAWLVGVLERMDYLVERSPGWAGPTGITSGRKPSEIFHEHVFCTFMRDQSAVKSRDIVGVKNILWGSDYPHIDSTWPHSTKVLEDHFDGVPLEDQQRIARQNAIELYHLPLAP
ncbi:MAG: amidohydrolase [Acidimicrobiaceae bacterium]|nr:amidohydrolase [Acidimicrobiaceae bacterium]